jgi:sec-independent protein translocase protein TatA
MVENRLLEIIIVALVLMVLFGAKRLPDTARSLGRSLRILKSEARAGAEEDKAYQTKAIDGAVHQPESAASTASAAFAGLQEHATTADGVSVER